MQDGDTKKHCRENTQPFRNDFRELVKETKEVKGGILGVGGGGRTFLPQSDSTCLPPLPNIRDPNFLLTVPPSVTFLNVSDRHFKDTCMFP